MDEEIKEETTNRVLGTKIDGLSRLTDERFLNLKETLERIEQTNFVTINSFNDRAKQQDTKIEELLRDKAKMQGSIDTLKVMGVIIGLITPVATILVSHYWK